jgi:hypothetical protein
MFRWIRVACGLSDAYQCSSGMWCRLLCMCTSVSIDTASLFKVEAPHAASYLLGSNIQIINTATMSLVKAFLPVIN